MTNKFFAAALIIAATLFVSGCRTLPPSHAPSGFAAYTDETPFRAVSPDGVMYRVRTTENKPFAELTFWKTALKKHMTESGYRFMAESDISADNLTGYQLELTAPQGDKDFTYLITLFVKGDTLIISEAAGDITRFKEHRKAIDEAIKKIN